MKYLLDTDICIYLINRKAPSLRAKFDQLIPGDVAVSTISVFELQYGMRRSQFPERNEKAFRAFLLPFTVLPFEESDAWVCGNVRANLEKAGQPIGPFDLLIAAQAVRNGLTLVSNNTREFKKVKHLKLENWVNP